MLRRPPQTRRRGATLAQAAVIIPLFLILVLAMLDAGVAIFRYHLVSQAARSGARHAIVHGSMAPPQLAAWTSGDAADEIHTQVAPYFGGLDFEVEAQYLDGSNTPGSRVQVTVTTTYQLKTFIFVNPELDLRADSIMTIAH